MLQVFSSQTVVHPPFLWPPLSFRDFTFHYRQTHLFFLCGLFHLFCVVGVPVTFRFQKEFLSCSPSLLMVLSVITVLCCASEGHNHKAAESFYMYKPRVSWVLLWTRSVHRGLHQIMVIIELVSWQFNLEIRSVIHREYIQLYWEKSAPTLWKTWPVSNFWHISNGV